VLRNQLTAMMKSFFGDNIGRLSAKHRPAKPKGHLHMNSNQVMYKHFDGKNCARIK